MSILRRLALLLTLVLLGALSLRLGLPLPVALVGLLGAGSLVFLRRPWAQVALAGGLALGSVAWVGMLGWRISERLALGRPWLRLACILGAVAAFTAWSAASAWRARKEA